MNDPQFEVGQKDYENAGFPPESFPRKQRGCFFYGCIIALILGLIGLILAGIVAYLGYTSIIKLRDEYTSTTPAEIPKADLPEDQRKALDERVAEFKKAAAGQKVAKPLDSRPLRIACIVHPRLSGVVVG